MSYGGNIEGGAASGWAVEALSGGASWQVPASGWVKDLDLAGLGILNVGWVQESRPQVQV